MDQSNNEACFFGPTPAEAKALDQPIRKAQTIESHQDNPPEPVPNKRVKYALSVQLNENEALVDNSDNKSSTIPLPANKYSDWMAKGKRVVSKKVENSEGNF